MRSVDDLVTDGHTGGARIVVGGHPVVEFGGFHYAPTIIDQIAPDVRLVVEEQFGPALPIVSYTDLDDAVRWANGTSYGLGASVWGDDLELAATLAVTQDAGTVTVNRHGIGRPDIAFAGHGWSGLGVENGRRGFEEFTALQAIGTPEPLGPDFSSWTN